MRLVGDHSGDLAREGLNSADHRLDKRVSQRVIGTRQIRPPKGNCKSTMALLLERPMVQ